MPLVSAQHWRDECLRVCGHTPLAGRTTDPEALNLDRAVEKFQLGLRFCREGSIEQGLPLIAAAVLLHEHSFQFVGKFPPFPRAITAEVGLHAMDSELLKELAYFDTSTGATGAVRLASQVLRILFYMDLDESQTNVARLLRQSEELIKAIEVDPTMEDEDSGPLDGCLRRTTLHVVRFQLYCSLGNLRKSVKELTAALEIDPSLASVRVWRANCMFTIKMIDKKSLFAELKCAVDDSHPDRHGLSEVYAALAYLAMEDPRLGTVEDACNYRTKSRQTLARQRELYGDKDFSDGEKKHVVYSIDDMEERFACFFSDPDMLAGRRRMDRDLIDQEWSQGLDEILGNQFVASSAHHYHNCVKCNKVRTSTGGKLFKCGKCREVSYCSKQCQQEDWEDHKKACKIVSKQKKSSKK